MEPKEFDEELFQRQQFENIKNLTFDRQIFNWYLLTRKNTDDYKLYVKIKSEKNVQKLYKQVIKNTHKQGSWEMSHDQLINIYLSKRFNQYVLKPMCLKKMKSH